MGSGQVIGPDGKAYVISIVGSAPTAEEQAQIDAIAEGKFLGFGEAAPATNADTQTRTDAAMALVRDKVGAARNLLPPTMGGVLAEQSPEASMRGDARTLERNARQEAATVRNVYSGLGGLGGTLAAGAIGAAPLPAALLAAGGVVAGNLIGAVPQAENEAARKLGVAPTREELLKESFGQGAASLAIDASLGAVGKSGKALLGLSNRARLIQDIDDAASIGIRATGGDLARNWVRTARKVVSIIPIIGGPMRAAENNRAREIATALGRFRGPLDPLVGEAEMSAQMLAAAANNFDSSVPWYKRFYQEAENHARTNNTRFDISGALQSAQDYNTALERGRLVLNRTKVATKTTATERATEFERTSRIAGKDKLAEGTLVTDGPQGSAVEQVGPASESFTATPDEAGLASRTTGITSTKALTTTTTSQQQTGLVQTFDTAQDVESFLEQLPHVNADIDFFQYDNLLKSIDSAWPKASNSQRIALTQVREQVENAARQTGDERFNFLYTNAKENFKLLKDFFSNPQARKFQLPDADIFDTATIAHIGGEKAEVSKLFSRVFDPEMGPDGIQHIVGLMRPEQAERAIQMSLRQRFDHYTVDQADKIDWSGLYREFGLNDRTSLRFQTFEAMLKNSNFGMTADEYKKGLDTLQSYTGEKLPQLSTQLIRSISLGNTTSALNNLTASRALQTDGIFKNLLGETLGRVVAKGGAITALLGARSLTSFLADPDKLRVMLRYVDEAQVPVPGSALPVTKFGMPVGLTTTEVGSGARQTYMATKRSAMRGLEKQMLRMLATEIGNRYGTSAADAAFKAKQLYEQMERGYNNPGEGNLEDEANRLGTAQPQGPQLPSVHGLFRSQLPQVPTRR